MKTIMNRTMWLTVLFAAQTFTAATAGNVSQTPLFLTASAQPNIMLLVDDSGSMQHIVPELPYVSGGYACSGPVFSNANQVDLGVDSGVPYFTSNFTSNLTKYFWAKNAAAGSFCFDANSDYAAQLFVGSGAGAGATYKGDYLNWYFGTDSSNVYQSTPSNWGSGATRKPETSSRMEIAQKAASSLVGSLNNANIGLASYDNDLGADIQISVANGNTDAAKLALTNAISALSPSGFTPLAETLLDIGRYFVGTDVGITNGHQSSQSCAVNGKWGGEFEYTLHPEGTTKTITHTDFFDRSPALGNFQSPICHFCQKNFVIMLTDGRATKDQTIPVEFQDFDGDCKNGGCSTFDRKPAPYSYEADGVDGTDDRDPSDYLDDVAQALYEIDLRPDIKDLDGHEVTNNISTYVIGFADDQVLNDQLLKDTAAQAGGEFLMAENSAGLLTALENAVSSIKAQLSSATAVTTSSTRLNTSTIAFQALFNSADWSGKLVAMPISGDGTVSSAVWSTSDSGRIPAHGSRNIFSYNPASSASSSYAFTEANLTTIQAVASAAGGSQPTEDQVSYIRGKRDRESSSDFRVRSSVLGDIINSDPLFVGKPTFGYELLGSASIDGGSYEAYRDGSGYLNRPNMLFVGANDGMLHAFDFSYSGGSASGSELFSYIPAAVVGNLSKLTSQNYSHQYFVDGSTTFSDVFIDPDGSGGGAEAWSTVLVGTTGAGGKGVYALDISLKSLFSETNVLWDLSPSNAASDLWAFSSNSTVSNFNDLGYTIGEASIVRMQDGGYYAVFGNGYNSGTDRSVIYIVSLSKNASNKFEVVALATGKTSSGMSSPLAVDTDNDRIADAIYAGDLEGNLWKVDVTGTQQTQWDFAYKSGGNPAVFFEAKDSANATQPITAKPAARKHDDGGVMVLFGTGKYFETDDNVISSPQLQSFYGVWDNGAVVSRSNLVAQQIVAEGTLFDFNVRVTTNKKVTYPTEKGWVLDLGLNAAAAGERVVNSAILRDDRVIFTTMIPSADPCAFGGSSWLMELNSLTGARLESSPFDLNDDGYFDSEDFIAVEDTNKDGVINSDDNLLPVSGISQTTLGLFDNPAIVEDGTKELKIMGGSSGNITTVKESKSGGSGRQSWQQLQ